MAAERGRAETGLQDDRQPELKLMPDWVGKGAGVVIVGVVNGKMVSSHCAPSPPQLEQLPLTSQVFGARPAA